MNWIMSHYRNLGNFYLKKNHIYDELRISKMEVLKMCRYGDIYIANKNVTDNLHHEKQTVLVVEYGNLQPQRAGGRQSKPLDGGAGLFHIVHDGGHLL